MEQIKRFLRGKGFALALAACVLAAAAMAVWAVQVLRGELEKRWNGAASEAPGASGIEQPAQQTEEADPWQQETAQAANRVSGVPKEPSASGSSGASASSAPRSGAASASGTVSEPRELRTDASSAAASAGRAAVRPVSGRMCGAYSGDELVYSKTLGDWRTHNGADYACSQGEAVVSPVAGTVTHTGADGNWGETVAVADAEGRVWRLCGVSAAKVKTGDTVAAGQTLGKAAGVPAECAGEEHIHLEVLQGQSYLDPAKLLG